MLLRHAKQLHQQLMLARMQRGTGSVPLGFTKYAGCQGRHQHSQHYHLALLLPPATVQVLAVIQPQEPQKLLKVLQKVRQSQLPVAKRNEINN